MNQLYPLIFFVGLPILFIVIVILLIRMFQQHSLTETEEETGNHNGLDDGYPPAALLA